eukprot:gene1045-10564_t
MICQFLRKKNNIRRFSNSIIEISKKLENKEISSTELTKQFLKTAKEINEKQNCYIQIFDDFALEQARKSDERRTKNESFGPLDGIPISIKDSYCVKGTKCTMGSKMLSNFVSPYNSQVFEQLCEKSGSILIGKTNLDEFAMGSSTTSSYFGKTKYIYNNQEYLSGGSSGGSAVSVQTNTSLASIGTDTGGSVRQPASYTGLVGFKPSYGHCSRYGMISYVSSMDTVGWLTNNIDDSALMTNILERTDSRDSSSHFDENNRINLEDLKKKIDLKDFTIGIPIEFFIEELDEKIINYWNESINLLKSEGAKIKYISLPNTKYALMTYYIIASAEAASNLSRYDGIRYGGDFDNLDSSNFNVKDLYTESRKLFGNEVKRRLILGNKALSIDEYDIFFKKSQQIRKMIANDFQNIFNHEGISAILSPTTPSTTMSFEKFEKLSPLEIYKSDIFTVHSNLAGIPAISIPIKVTKNELPFGMQFMSNNSMNIFKIGKIFESLQK